MRIEIFLATEFFSFFQHAVISSSSAVWRVTFSENLMREIILVNCWVQKKLLEKMWKLGIKNPSEVFFENFYKIFNIVKAKRERKQEKRSKKMLKVTKLFHLTLLMIFHQTGEISSLILPFVFLPELNFSFIIFPFRNVHQVGAFLFLLTFYIVIADYNSLCWNKWL